MAKINVYVPEPPQEYTTEGFRQINQAISTVENQLNTSFQEELKQEIERFTWFNMKVWLLMSCNNINAITGGSTVSDVPFYLAVQQGQVSGYSSINKFGYNENVPTSWEVIAVSSTNFTYPSSAGTATVVSDDANDTSAGTGARTVRIQGLDGDYNFQEETITMNGTTGVTSSNTFLRLNRMEVMTAGSSGSMEGTITADVGGNELSRMEQIMIINPYKQIIQFLLVKLHT